MTFEPREWIDGCVAAHRRLEATVEVVTDNVARRPSLLEGWSVGHILNHLARNADSHGRVFAAAHRGEVVAQYAGGPAERARGIADGADKPAGELAQGLRAANERLEAAWAATSEEVWASGLGLRTAGAVSIPDFVFLRWREVEIHLVDLGLVDLGGPDWSGISPEYLDPEWQMSLFALPPRLESGTAVDLIPGDRPSRVIGSSKEPIIVRGTSREILKWLVGRGGNPSWPTLGPWT